MSRKIDREPTRRSSGLRALQGLQSRLEKDFPGLRDPNVEVVLERGNISAVNKPKRRSGKRAS